MRIHLIISAVLTTMAVCSSSGTAQPNERYPWWITMGGGVADAGGTMTMSLGVAYSQLWDASLISGRILGATNDNPTVRRIDPATTTYRLTDYGILYGPAWHDEDGYVSAGAGLGLVRTKIETPAEASVRSGISLPLEAQAFYQVVGSFGIGVYVFTSINGIRTFSGAMLSVQMGVMDPMQRAQQ